jgi:beta-galactosidase
LVERDLVEVNLDYGQTGIGGDDSWGARPHDEYTLFPKEYSYSFRLRPITKSDDLMAMSKIRFELKH